MRPETVFRLLLALYPRDFRDRHGEEMTRLFLERHRDARADGGRWGAAGLWVGTVCDALSTAGREWWERLGGAGSGGPAGAGAAERRGSTGRTGRTGGGGVDGWMADLRYGVRTLLRRPGFTAVTVVTVALGIGVNTAIFSVVRSVLLRPLPYVEAERIVLVWGEMRNRDVNHFPASPADLSDYREMSTVFDELAGVFTFAQPLTGEGDPEQVQAGVVTEGFMEVLGVRPVLGRSFAPPDHAPADAGGQQGAAAQVTNAVLLTHHLWQQRWGGDPDVVGRVVDLGGTPSEIVGVLPPDFAFLVPPAYALEDRPDIWQAGRFDPETAPRNNVFLRLVGRLGPGVSVEQAQAEMDRIAADLRALWPIKASSDHHIHVRPLRAELTSHVRPVLLALAGAVGLVLLVACANVSNLLLVRATGRRHELAVRAALGGGRWRLVRQTLLEGVVLAVAGGALGVLLAVAGIDLLLALQPGNVPRLEEVAVDLPVLAFTGAAVALAALLVGLLPALQTSRPDVAAVLGERGRAGGGLRAGRTRSAMVVAEVALSLILLVGAGLLVRSFVSLQQVDPGFEAEDVVTFQVNLPFGRYPQPGDRHRAMTTLREGFAALPGVASATAAFPLPLDGQLANVRWGKEDALENPEEYRQADVHFVAPDYFETLGTRVLAGRTFSAADHADSTDVMVLDEVLARRAFPELERAGGLADVVGRRLLVRALSPEPEWREIVGVVEHQRHHDLAREGQGSVYFTQRFAGSFGGTWAVRAAGDAAALVPGIRRVVERIDPLLPVAEVEPMAAALARARAPTRFALVLMGVFAGLAGLLAAVGLYGVMAHVVRQQTGEIGVRMAFGAPRGRILRQVVGRGLGLSLLGVLLGVGGALLLARAMEGLVVGVEPRDPVTFVAVPALFLAVAAAAAFVPAWRASRVDPAEALRQE